MLNYSWYSFTLVILGILCSADEFSACEQVSQLRCFIDPCILEGYIFWHHTLLSSIFPKYLSLYSIHKIILLWWKSHKKCEILTKNVRFSPKNVRYYFNYWISFQDLAQALIKFQKISSPIWKNIHPWIIKRTED